VDRSKFYSCLSLLLGLTLVGCVFDPAEETGPGEPKVDPKPFTSISNTMFNFDLAQESQDIHLYEECLAPDYQFVLDPDDADEVGVGFYSREEDVAQMERIFNSPDLVDMRFDAVAHSQEDVCWDQGECVSSLVSDWAEINYTVQIEIQWQDGLERACGTAIFSFDHSNPDEIRIVRIVDFTGQGGC
jgi:hypothetical protein